MYGDGEFGGFDGGGGQFGAADQFGGGGFGGGEFGGGFGGSQAGNNMSQGGGFHVDNSGPEGKAKGNRDRQSIIPTTIKQLRNATPNASGEQGFTIDGRDLYNVTCVGLIQNLDETSTHLQFTIDDGTGQMVFKMWMDADTDESFAERRAQWKEGVVVRVIGQLRAFNSTRSVVAFSIRPIEDFNEYTFHFIEVVHSHLRATKGAPLQQPKAYNAPPMMGGMPVQAPVGAAAAPAAGTFNPNALNEMVLNYFNTHGTSETGCTIAEVTEALASQGLQMGQVREIVEHLSNEGLLYSTVDDDHYKSTSA